MTGKAAPQTQKTTPRPAIALSQPGILQRTCECGNVSGLTGKCEACAGKRLDGRWPAVQLGESRLPADDATIPVQRARLGGYRFQDLAIHPDQRFGLQTKLKIGSPKTKPLIQRRQLMLAHGLTHTAQQQIQTPLRGKVLQRNSKAPAKNTAAGGPKLNFRPAKHTPPCACLVFMHHNEPNARLMAQLMYEFCRYNLAIVTPQTKSRKIKLPSKGKIDPNELFPRKVAEECLTSDKPCEDFLAKHAKSTKASVVKEYAQRQFFLAIKKCSNSFSLPVVALHNNAIKDTKRYRKAVGASKSPLDLTPVKGKTFDDTLKSGEKPATPDTAPFEDLKEWLLKKMPGVKKKTKVKKGAKRTITGGPIKPGQTNIFLWCTAEDISRCHIGDPKRPDNVVWVTNSADFEKLRGTKTNVVLQTRVDPKGKSATDLSSLFVFLEEILGKKFSAIILQLEQDIAVDADAISDAIKELRKLQTHGDLMPGDALNQLLAILARIIRILLQLLALAQVQDTQALKRSQLRYINIETPQSAYDPKTTKPADLRVQSYRDVRATLSALGLDCCDTKPAQGETESAVEKVEKALKAGKLPKTVTKSQ